MLTKSIKLKSFKKKNLEKNLNIKLKLLLNNKTELLKSLSKDYVDKYKISRIKKIVGKNNIRLIGMGGSILGSQAIYEFLKDKIKKIFFL